MNSNLYDIQSGCTVKTPVQLFRNGCAKFCIEFNKFFIDFYINNFIWMNFFVKIFQVNLRKSNPILFPYYFIFLYLLKIDGLKLFHNFHSKSEFEPWWYPIGLFEEDIQTIVQMVLSLDLHLILPARCKLLYRLYCLFLILYNIGSSKRQQIQQHRLFSNFRIHWFAQNR